MPRGRVVDLDEHGDVVLALHCDARGDAYRFGHGAGAERIVGDERSEQHTVAFAGIEEVERALAAGAQLHSRPGYSGFAHAIPRVDHRRPF